MMGINHLHIEIDGTVGFSSWIGIGIESFWSVRVRTGGGRYGLSRTSSCLLAYLDRQATSFVVRGELKGDVLRLSSGGPSKAESSS